MESPVYSPDTTGDPGIKLVILEEPAPKLRFRYLSELQGTPHGPLLGANGSKANKTYPTVQLVGYQGDARIRCWMVDGESSNLMPHVHDLAVKSKRGKGNISYDPHEGLATYSNSHTVSFEDMVVLHTVISSSESKDRYKRKVEKWMTRFEHLISSSTSTMTSTVLQTTMKRMAKNVVYLYFEAVTLDNNLLASAMSGPIKNMKDRQSGELKIVVQSLYGGSCDGGDEVLLFTSKLPTKFKVQFYDKKGWMDYGDFQPSDIHQHCALKFRTPPYQPNGGAAFFKIIRESDNDDSNECHFQYNPSRIIVLDEPKQFFLDNSTSPHYPAEELLVDKHNSTSRRRPAEEPFMDKGHARKRKLIKLVDGEDFLSKFDQPVVTEPITEEIERILAQDPTQSVSFHSSDRETLMKILEDDVSRGTNLPSPEQLFPYSNIVSDGPVRPQSSTETVDVVYRELDMDTCYYGLGFLSFCHKIFDPVKYVWTAVLRNDNSKGMIAAGIAVTTALYSWGICSSSVISIISTVALTQFAFSEKSKHQNDTTCFQRDVLTAIQANDLAKLKECIKEKENMRFDYEGAVKAAVKSNWLEGLILLHDIFNIANFGSFRTDDTYLVHVAAKQSAGVLKFVLFNSDPECLLLKSSDQKTALHIALGHKKFKNAIVMIRHAEVNSMLNEVCGQCDGEGNNILHMAVIHENLPLVKTLSYCMSDCLDERNLRGQTALDLAELNGYHAAIHILGSDKSKFQETTEEVNFDKNTSLNGLSESEIAEKIKDNWEEVCRQNNLHFLVDSLHGNNPHKIVANYLASRGELLE